MALILRPQSDVEQQKSEEVGDVSKSYNQCCICKIHTPAIHKHHVIPRSLGGKDDWLINLCGQCHTTLHSHASFLTAKTHKKEVPVFWLSESQEQAAHPYVEQIVAAKLRMQDTSSKLQKSYTITIPVSGKLYMDIKKLQTDFKVSSIQKTITLCIEHVLKKHGIV